MINRRYSEHREYKLFQMKELIKDIELELSEVLTCDKVLMKNKIKRVQKMFFEIALRLD